MTDTEIKKALECCSKGFGNCDGCPYDDDNADCVTLKGETLMMKDVIDLINRQQAEIERLKSPKFFIENEVSEKELSEMLKKGRVGVIPHIKCSIRRIEEDGIRADAIKGFANKLDTYIMWHFPIDDPFVADIRLKIDKLVKEMVGESNVETDITANI